MYLELLYIKSHSIKIDRAHFNLHRDIDFGGSTGENHCRFLIITTDNVRHHLVCGRRCERLGFCVTEGEIGYFCVCRMSVIHLVLLPLFYYQYSQPNQLIYVISLIYSKQECLQQENIYIIGNIQMVLNTNNTFKTH